jgi:hypothetical protein
MDQSLKAGFFGFLLATAINLFLPISLYFIPQFLAAIVAIYIHRLGTIKDGLVASFVTYVFNDVVLNTLIYISMYLTNEPYTATVDIVEIIYPIVNAASILIACYIGVWLVQKTKRAAPSPSATTSTTDRPIVLVKEDRGFPGF